MRPRAAFDTKLGHIVQPSRTMRDAEMACPQSVTDASPQGSAPVFPIPYRADSSSGVLWHDACVLSQSDGRDVCSTMGVDGGNDATHGGAPLGANALPAQHPATFGSEGYGITSADKARRRRRVVTHVYMAGQYEVQWGQLSAGVMISTIPVAILFTFLQKHLIKGLTAGAMKG